MPEQVVRGCVAWAIANTKNCYCRFADGSRMLWVFHTGHGTDKQAELIRHLHPV